MRSSVLLALLSGCSVLKPVSDQTRYYVLTELPAKMPHAPRELPSVGLERIELPEYLNRTELVARRGDNELVISDSDRWGEPIQEGIDRTLRRDLAAQLGADRIDAPPWGSDGAPVLVIEIELRRFERVDDRVELDGTFIVRDGKSGKTLMARGTRSSQPLKGDTPQATVDALSRALAALSTEIAETVRNRR